MFSLESKKNIMCWISIYIVILKINTELLGDCFWNNLFCLENKLIGGDKKVLTNSREIAEKYGKRNPDMNRIINNFIKRNPELSKHFIESTYISSRGRREKQFEIDDFGVDILTNKYKYNIRSARFEYKYLNEIEDFLNLMNIDYIEQYPVDNYRIDLYIPKFNLAIEIDEEEHKYKKDYDAIRQKYIEKQINCTFIRVNEGESCGSAIARIAKKLYKSA